VCGWGAALQVLSYRRHVERPVHAECAVERPALVGEVDARQVGMHGGAPPGQATLRVDDEDAVGHDDAQQAGPVRAHPAPHTGAYRALAASR